MREVKYGLALTASRSSSASFSLPPGASKVDRSRTLISAQGRSCVVFAGRSHLGRGNASAGLRAMGMFTAEVCVTH